MDKPSADVHDLQLLLQYRWRDQSLLHQALVHSSYTYECRDKEEGHNERLEFLGDAVLQIIVSEHYYKLFHDKTEGELSRMRALTVCEASLARVAKRFGLGRFILLGRGEERSGGRERASLLADAVEALLGSIYLDGGLKESRRVTLFLLTEVMEEVLTGQALRDYKTELQELLQRDSAEPVLYRIVNESGPDHDKLFTAVLSHAGASLGEGMGRTKKEAEQQAARMAMEKIQT
ncbi:MAG: ribonuclease III [Firmicutes bacterium]|nr:ribonuclease III [Bacillota bacterium]